MSSCCIIGRSLFRLITMLVLLISEGPFTELFKL